MRKNRAKSKENGHIVLHSRRHDAYRRLSRQERYFAEESLLANRNGVAHLWFAVRADAIMILRPKVWAIFMVALDPKSVYQRYQAIRKGVA